MTDIDPLIPQSSLHYKTFIKESVVSALRLSMGEYITDITLVKTKIDIDYSSNEADYPAVVVKFYERDNLSSGVAHIEYGPDPNADGFYIPYQHRLYHGDMSFEIYALSSLDRDLVTDALIEILAMGQSNPEASTFYTRLYTTLQQAYYQYHFLVFNTDEISGYGEQAGIAPWGPEDTLLYQASYRIPVIGEFYSLPPASPSSSGVVSEVDIYPWDPLDPSDIDPSTFSGGVIPNGDYIKFQAIPENSIAPIITGTLSLGQTLFCTTGTWTNSPTSYTYQWENNGLTLSGATSPTYVIQTSDLNENISCEVTATIGIESTVATSEIVVPH